MDTRSDSRSLEIYDTTLRDGAQAEDVSFSVEDKVHIALKLDELGIQYIEGGWPGANPKDIEFFRVMKTTPLAQATIVAFGSTRKADHAVQTDPNLQALLSAETTTVTLFGKSWTLHVTEALGTSLEKNIALIGDSITYLCDQGRRVFYDAEHFFDGYKTDADYAMKTLKKAEEAGASRIVLCDTNGGSMPWEIQEIFSAVKKECSVPLGIHAHNDAELGVANSIVAINAGARQVQGTINGIGERCGNANLCSIIANLELKMKQPVLGEGRLAHLRQVSMYVSDIANLLPNKRQPYIGDTAFAHKGGVHIHAVQKNPVTYEHISPEDVGNHRRVLISDNSGRSAVLGKMETLGLRVPKEHEHVQTLLSALKDREYEGYQFEGAEGSFELMVKKALGEHTPFFDLLGCRVIIEKRQTNEQPVVSEATIMVKVGGVVEHTAAIGDGPVNALDNALRKALEKFYPQLKDVKLLDYKVRVLSGSQGTGSRVRVLIESGDHKSKWSTVGVSDNIIEASWQALVDSIEYKLLQEERPSS
ncbi:MAG: citramalate synthase [Nitrospirales bacterium]|nr:citramalate synthase [Nitrospira sp.]MDR4501589.1 citramalate synthase [Nitrospirales bacterium]